MNWKKLLAKIWTPKNQAKALDAGAKLLAKQAAKREAKAADKNTYKSGAIVIDDLAFIAICALCVFSGLVGGKGGLKTRCAIQQAEINIHGSSNVVTIVQSSNTVDVSGSGGVSVPLTGGGK